MTERSKMVHRYANSEGCYLGEARRKLRGLMDCPETEEALIPAVKVQTTGVAVASGVGNRRRRARARRAERKVRALPRRGPQSPTVVDRKGPQSPNSEKRRRARRAERKARERMVRVQTMLAALPPWVSQRTKDSIMAVARLLNETALEAERLRIGGVEIPVRDVSVVTEVPEDRTPIGSTRGTWGPFPVEIKLR